MHYIEKGNSTFMVTKKTIKFLLYPQGDILMSIRLEVI